MILFGFVSLCSYHLFRSLPVFFLPPFRHFPTEHNNSKILKFALKYKSLLENRQIRMESRENI